MLSDLLSLPLDHTLTIRCPRGLEVLLAPLGVAGHRIGGADAQIGQHTIDRPVEGMPVRSISPR